MPLYANIGVPLYANNGGAVIPGYNGMPLYTNTFVWKIFQKKCTFSRITACRYMRINTVQIHDISIGDAFVQVSSILWWRRRDSLSLRPTFIAFRSFHLKKERRNEEAKYPSSLRCFTSSLQRSLPPLKFMKFINGNQLRIRTRRFRGTGTSIYRPISWSPYTFHPL